jgi:hypothetical protein
VTISLEGFVFFGSAVKLLEEVKRHVVINTQLDDDSSDSDLTDDTAYARCSTEMSPLLASHKSKASSYSSPTKTSNAPHSPSKSSEHSGSFSQLQPVYGLTSDQIMAHHNKWKQIGSSSSEATTRRGDKKRDFTDVAIPEEDQDLLGHFSNQALGKLVMTDVFFVYLMNDCLYKWCYIEYCLLFCLTMFCYILSWLCCAVCVVCCDV